MIRLALMIFAVISCGAQAQSRPSPLPGGYPSRPIRMIVTISPGGGPDIVTRIVAQLLTEKLGQSVVVDNRPGGGTVLATDLVATAAPDGHTLLVGTDSLMLVGAMKRVPYDIRTAFEPVVQMTTQWYVLVVTPSLPVKSVKELIAYARSKPDALSYASQGMGTTGHLSMENFRALTGTNMVHVPYKGAAPALLDIIGGQIQLMFSSTVSAFPQMASGKVRGIAITSPQRVRQQPELPTVAEASVPNFKASNTYGLYAPAGTPKPIVLGINRMVTDSLRTPETMKRLAMEGTEPSDPMTPDEFKAAIAKEYVLVEKLVKQINIKLF